MSVNRQEYVMVGVFRKELPFDEFEDKYEPYCCGMDNEPLWIITLSNYSDEGYVIGRALANGDSDTGIELKAITDDISQITLDLPAEIGEKLDITVSQDEIKLYAFSSWIQDMIDFLKDFGYYFAMAVCIIFIWGKKK